MYKLSSLPKFFVKFVHDEKRKREEEEEIWEKHGTMLSVTDTRANTQQRVKGVVSATETHNGWRAHAARPCNYQRARVWVTRVHACTDVEEESARGSLVRLPHASFFLCSSSCRESATSLLRGGRSRIAHWVGLMYRDYVFRATKRPGEFSGTVIVARPWMRA